MKTGFARLAAAGARDKGKPGFYPSRPIYASNFPGSPAIRRIYIYISGGHPAAIPLPPPARICRPCETCLLSSPPPPSGFPPATRPPCRSGSRDRARFSSSIGAVRCYGRDLTRGYRLRYRKRAEGVVLPGPTRPRTVR